MLMENLKSFSGIRITGELRLQSFKKQNQVTRQGVYGILQSLDPGNARQAISHIMFLYNVPATGLFATPELLKFVDIAPHIAYNSITSVSGSMASVITATTESTLTMSITTTVLSGIFPGVDYTGAALIMNGDILQGLNVASYTPNGNERLLAFVKFDPITKVMWDDFVGSWVIKVSVDV